MEDIEFFTEVYPLETINECQNFYNALDEEIITDEDREFFKKTPWLITKPSITEDGSRVFDIGLTFKSSPEDLKDKRLECLANFCKLIDGFIYIEYFCRELEIYHFEEYIGVYLGYREDNTPEKRYRRVKYLSLKN